MLTTMGTKGFCLCFIFFIKINLLTGQSLPQEELLDIKTCTLNSVDLNCDNDDMIAFQSAHFYYHATCESTCCQYSSDHDTVGASVGDITDIRRQCSGKSSCTLNIDGVRTFDSGGKLPSYAILSYYCIPKSRTASICSADKLSSGGSLLYLTNEGFPSVTTDHRSCSCSLEVYSCASEFNMYLVDADMYLDEVNCQQRIDIFDGKNASLWKINCTSYYTNEIVTSTFNRNYIRFDFTDNSSANQEGIFFIGFGATEPNVTFKMSCAAEPQTTCIDCGAPNGIPNGDIALNSGTTSSGSQATVSCHNGYETDNATLICLETGQWTNSTCSPKDCGELYTIPNGNLTSAVDGRTSFGAKANVACDPGYKVSSYCNRSTEFQCGDGTCINKTMRCDAFPHCPNELDELLCQDVISCPEGQKLCDVTCVNEQETCEESETSVAETDAGTISCLVIAKWEKVKCSAKDCGTPTNIENGNITLTKDGETTYMSTADVTCDTGFTPSIALISCEADGSWENGTCNLIDCGVPSVPNGTVTLTNPGESTFGSTAEIECNEGFTSSVSSITCQTSGQWENASCGINDCGGLDTITNGTLQLKIEGKTTYGSTASVSCETGFTPSVTEITCTANGEWKNATCMINDCRDLDQIKNGTLQLTTEGKTTYGSTATVTCETGFTPSPTEIICQANSEWKNATCTINDCGGLGTIANGTLQQKTEGKTTYGSTATVSCETGFTPSVTEITCTANGEWENATCMINDCRELDLIKNGTLQLTTEGKTSYGSTATVTCETGFTPLPTEIICQANSEWENATCRINDCGGLGTIANGTLQQKTEGKTTYGSTATVSCESGFTPSVTEITCTANGEWENATCMINDCRELDLIKNGTLQLTTEGKTTYGSTATVTCETGFTPLPTEIICQANSEWENATCRINDCGGLGTIANGTLQQKTEGKTTYGSTATVSCESGFTPSVTEITCTANGEWENATCMINDCRELDLIKNGTLQLTTEGKTTYGSTATVTCETGFTPLPTEIICQANSEWENATCRINDCGGLDSITNGTLQLTTVGKTTYGSMATVSCETGFTPSATEITCKANAEWENAICMINDCGELASITNGILQLTREGKTTYGSTATVTCETGFIPSQTQIICQANSDWENATCKINDCGGLDTIANGTLQLKTEGKTTYRSTATVSCETGFTPSVIEITCTANGEWENATCMINDCRDLDPIKNGTLQLTTEGKTTYGSTARVTCETGFTPSLTEIICQANGEWKNATCTINDCGGLDTITNGTLQLKTEEKTNYGSTATVSCETGFTPSVTEITCTANGEWENATCVINDCGGLDLITNGKLQLTTVGKTTYGSMATLSCETGFTPSAKEITCTANAEWEYATCMINDCGELASITNGTLQLTREGKTTYGSTATVTCETGFIPSQTRIICQANSDWENATCKINDCDELDLIANGILQLETEGKVTYGSMATVSCDTGFTPSVTEITCTANGKWENATCVINDCRELDPIKNGTLQLRIEGKTTYGSTATVTCETGFTPSPTEIICQANSEWENATCSINDCGGLDSITNGTLQLKTVGKTTYGSMATVSCETGFTPLVTEITCTANGEWENATCKINDCDDLASITNGTLQLTREGKTTFGSTATITCETGFTPTRAEIICKANSEWENATCKINDCGGLDTIANGTLQLKTEGKTTYGSMATVSCETGFTPSVIGITCTANGEWENTTCRINDCGDLASITNGTLQLTREGKTTYGSTATVTCVTGFTPSSTEIVCQANSEWENSKCNINDCNGLQSIANGTVQLKIEGKTTYNSMATVSCETGFTPSVTEISCTANGEWENATCMINDCGELASIKNGTLQLKTEGKTTYGSTATVTCETGFTPTRASIACQTDSQWEIVTCNIIDCGMPTTISNGNFTLDSRTTYLSTAKITCESVYHATRESIICQEDGTWTTAFCVLTDCGKPHEIENGVIRLETGDNTTFVSKAIVECDTGFTSSDEVILCMENGTWETAFCEINDCGEPTAMDNGALKLGPENKTTYGSTATVTCDTGFTPSRTSISCQANSKWEKVICNIKDCNEPTPIDNGTLKLGPENKTTYGSTATVTCDTGFTPSHTSISCQANSKWEKVICNIKDCNEPTPIDNGTLKLGPENKTTYGSTATVTCDTGFTPSRTSISCQANSKWEKVICNIKDCNEPTPIDNGTLKLGPENKTTYGSTATVMCDTGFTPSRTSISCQANSKWEKVICNIKDCNEPTPIDNGTLKLGPENKTTYGSTATVMCDTGFTPSHTSISCQANSKWEKVICNIKDCNEPTPIDNGTLKLGPENKTTYGSTATVMCDTGFTPSRTSISCQANSQWENVICNINDCEMPATISNGNITLDSLTTYLSKATVSCASGYQATRESIICQANGTWTSAFCVLTDCGKPDEIENGIIRLQKEDNTAFVSRAIVECDAGFSPSPEVILCMENGTWETAFCQINECGSLPALDNGQITLPDNKPTYVGVTAMVSCNIGYKKSSTFIRCLPSGQWQNVSCDIINCGNPPTIEHGNVTVLEGSFTTYDSVAQVRCHKGYKPKERFVACTETGVWEISSCVEIDQDVFIIISAVGAAVLLIALLVLAILIMWDKSMKTSANLHSKRKHSPNLRTNTEGTAFNETYNRASLQRIDSVPIQEDLFDYIDNPDFDPDRYDIPMEGHIMYPYQFADLENKVLSHHEPHAWHTEVPNSLGDFNHGYRL